MGTPSHICHAKGQNDIRVMRWNHQGAVCSVNLTHQVCASENC